MRRRAVPPPEMITKINVTPIIDVALVLVIILLVTAPLLSVADLPVNLPQARTRDLEDERNLSITLGAAGELAVDEQVIAPAALGPVLRARLAEPGNREVLVVVRADSQASYAAVRRILEAARSAGAARLAIAAEQRAREDR